MTARIFKLAYQLRLHRVGGWALDRWAVTLAWGVSAFIVTRWTWRGQPILPAWHWLILALLVLSGAAVMFLRGWAARRSYVVFLTEPGWAPPAPLSLLPEDKTPLRATGRFDVQNRERLFADLPAYWRTYASRKNMRCWPFSTRPASSWRSPGRRMPGCGMRLFRLRRS